MAKGYLGSADLVANVATPIFTTGGAAGTAQTFNLRLANRTGFPTQVQIAITSGGAPAAADYINYNGTVPDNGILEETGLVSSPGEVVYVLSSAAGMSVRAHGL